MSKKVLIGVIVADVDEFNPFVKAAKKYNAQEYTLLGKKGITFDINGATVISINCGIGKVNASAVASALASLNCNAILNFGLSGGISGASRGGLCVPDKFLEHDFDLTVLGYKPCEKPNQKYIYGVNSKLLEISKQVANTEFTGTVTYTNEKGYGFITEDKTGENVFFHQGQLEHPISKNEKVSYEKESTVKGIRAINIQKLTNK